MTRLRIACSLLAAHVALSLFGADAGLRALSGQAVTSSELNWAFLHLAVYAGFVLITPVLVLSVVLEPPIRALLRARRAER